VIVPRGVVIDEALAPELARVIDVALVPGKVRPSRELLRVRRELEQVARHREPVEGDADREAVVPVIY
jgi:hypothetical protein